MSAEPLTRAEREHLKVCLSQAVNVPHFSVADILRYEATVQEAEERLQFVAAQWAAEVELERERAERLAEALDDAIQLADEGWSYASDYFRNKWNYTGEADALRAILDANRTKEER